MHDEHSDVATTFSKHRFAVFIVGAIVLSFVLVAISLSLYVSSGASQLDLSRPGFEKIRAQVQDDDSFQGFSSDGPLGESALNEFEKKYSEKLKQGEKVDAFGNDVLSPESLQFDNTGASKDDTQQ